MSDMNDTIVRKPLQNDLFLRALDGQAVDRPPVWMMRQAGRYLPEYRALRAKYGFFERCQTPELVAEITTQPIDIVGPDAAILFSDILVVPQAMGVTVEMHEGKGPLLPQVIRTMQDVNNLDTNEAADKLQYVYDGIQATLERLDGRVPLIGFAGAPWTILCYMVQGKGSKTFDEARAFCYSQPEVAHALLDAITKVTIEYLKRQVNAGVYAVQVFDSWAGMLSPAAFDAFAKPYMLRIIDALKSETRVIAFAKGSWYALEELSGSGAHALGLDWCVPAAKARLWTGGKVTLQGNLDPAILLGPVEQIRRATEKMIDEFGVDRYVANLGHGITPDVPVDHARAFIDAVRQYKRKN